MKKYALRSLLFILLSVPSYCRRHTVTVHDDDRKIITCTTFGFLQDSYLGIHLSDLKLPAVEADAYSFGFTLDKTDSAGVSSYFENKRDKCVLRDEIAESQVSQNEDSDVKSSIVRDEVALLLLRINLRKPTDNYKSSRIVLSTSGRSDLDQLSLFEIPEGEYSDWQADPHKIPLSFQLSSSDARYRVYSALWRRFFDRYVPRMLQSINLEDSASKKCPQKLVSRARNDSLGDLFSRLLADEMARVGNSFSYLPLQRSQFSDNTVTVANTINNANRLPNAGSVKAGGTNGNVHSAAITLGNLEDFSTWFNRVLEHLRSSLASAKQPLQSAYSLGGSPLSSIELSRLLTCVVTVVNADDRVTVIEVGDVASRDFQSAVFDSFRIPATNGSLTLAYNNNEESFSAQFIVAVKRPEEEGLYTMYFHNCPPRDSAGGAQSRSPNAMARVAFKLDVVEKNQETFLSATESALPALNFAFSLLYAMLTVVWIAVLWYPRTRAAVYKIHYLMLLLLLLKTLAFLFHGINYHVIGQSGRHEEAWAVMYYVTHLVKGAVLFLTVALIGAGWAFIKHVLSERDKKILIIVIPLQILANIAKIIIEESEESMQSYTFLKEVLTLLDLVCCGAILFPIVWSIRHLQQAARTDGKAAFSLEKLRLFQHFYILVVCYIYFTRIMAYLIRITVSFRYDWVDELFTELTTLVFFVVSGYKFRPASNNPYLVVPTEELDDDVVVTSSGVLDNVQQTVRGRSRQAARDREAELHRRDANETERQLLAQGRLDVDIDDEDVVWDTRIMHETVTATAAVSTNQKHKLNIAEDFE